MSRHRFFNSLQVRYNLVNYGTRTRIGIVKLGDLNMNLVGFPHSLFQLKVLAKKMTVLYKLSKEQLSKQYHYDFGLRALKSVLVMAGGLKRQYSEMPEDLVLMRALRDSNMPKFVFEDVPLFKGLINDLFPNMDCPRVGYEDLKVEVRKELETKGFRCSDDQVFADQVRLDICSCF